MYFESFVWVFGVFEEWKDGIFRMFYKGIVVFRWKGNRVFFVRFDFWEVFGYNVDVF